jgi:uncharacterized protein YkwD
MIDDTWPARALAALNAHRASVGAGPLEFDPGLMAAAEELAIPLGDGRAEAHDGFPDRVRRHGWPFEDAGIRNRGFGNVSEGCGEGGRTPEEAVSILWSARNPREGHRRDVEDPAFTHVGIAFAENRGREYGAFGGCVVVVDYGARRGG